MKLVLPFLALCALLGGVFHRPLLEALGGLVVYEKSDFSRVDAVVVLSGVIPDRSLQAVELLRDSRAELAILFAASVPPRFEPLGQLGIDYTEDYEVNRAVLLKSGIEEKRIRILPDRVSSTWEEALAFRSFLVENEIHSIAISTCRFHSYRAYLNFAKALEDKDIEIFSAPSRYCEFRPSDWWTNRDQIKRLYVELTSLAAFFVGRR